MRLKLQKYTSILILAAFITGCVGKGSSQLSENEFFPDYTDITIPCNMAPLNFVIGGAKSIKVKVNGSKNHTFSKRGQVMIFGMKRWHRMLKQERGSDLTVTVTWKSRESGRQSRSFGWRVSAEEIDPYLSYRLIEPAYEVWNQIEIEERNVESFQTRLIGNNYLAGRCCMNCHISNKNGTSFLHLRGSGGGTVVNREGKITKIDTKTDQTMGGAVYGDISADGRYGVFAAANISFAIHSARTLRMEVYDSASDLIVIDLDSLTVTDSPAVKGGEYQETFPCFSADGKSIFFCRARHVSQPDSTRNMFYDIAGVTFDPATGKVGSQAYTVISGEKRGVSFSHLKVSPDGRFLMATAAAYGTFPAWHPESELWLIDLATGKINTMPETGAPYADTYHSWSSNSRWIVFGSKRGDKVYTVPYIAFVGEDGKSGKAFALPQKNPLLYKHTLKSYNLPELYTAPEDYNSRDLARLYNSVENTPVTYKPGY